MHLANNFDSHEDFNEVILKELKDVEASEAS